MKASSKKPSSTQSFSMTTESTNSGRLGMRMFVVALLVTFFAYRNRTPEQPAPPKQDSSEALIPLDSDLLETLPLFEDHFLLAVPADIVDAGHGERNFTCMREPRVRLEL